MPLSACILHARLGLEVGVNVQIRNVPDDVHRKLKARAAMAGMSLNEYVRTLLVQATSRPTPQELYAEIQAAGPIGLPEPSEVTIRRIRDAAE